MSPGPWQGGYISDRDPLGPYRECGFWVSVSQSEGGLEKGSEDKLVTGVSRLSWAQ